MHSKIKNLASDTVVYGLFTIVGRFLTFMLTPLYANYLTNDDQLNFVYFLYSLIPLVIIFYSFGMESSFFRFFEKDQPESHKKSFSNSFLSIFLTSILFTIVIFTFSGSIANAMTFDPIPDQAFLIKIAAIIIMLDAWLLVPYALLRMERKAFKFALTKFILIIIQVGLNILFIVYLDMSAEGVLYANLASTIVGIGIFLPEIIKYLQLKFDKELLKRMLRFGLPTFPASISAMVLHVGDRPMLQWLSDSPLALNIYQTNYRLAIPMLLFVTVFEYAWKPFYLSNFKEKDSKEMFAKILTYFTLVSSFIFLSASLFMKYAVQIPLPGGNILIPEKFWSGLGIIPIIIGGYFFNGIYLNISAGFLIEKETKYLPLAFGIGAAANIILNIIFVPIYGFWASAWATLAAYFIAAVILYINSRKIYPIEYEWKKVGTIILLSFLALSLVNGISSGLSEFMDILTRILIMLGVYVVLIISGVISKSDLKGIIRFFSRKRVIK